MSVQSDLSDLRNRLREARDLGAASAVLQWDQTTFMPSGGAAGRARQLAVLSRLAHESATDPEIGRLLDRLAPYAESLPPEHDDAALLRVARYDFERVTRVPAEYSERAARHASTTYAAWVEARPKNDFARLRPKLETTLDLSREYASFFPGYEHVADPLIDDADQGMTVARIRPVFDELRAGLTPLVARIAAAPQVDDAPVRKHFPARQQSRFAERVIKSIGYDFERGRLDPTAHPFMTRFAHGDVRITTRTNENFLAEQLFSTIHEAGHALYEQGTQAEDDGLPLGSGTSAGVHESQSRLWENIVGRSLGFWSHWYPTLQAEFPEQLGDVDLRDFYAAVNRVEPSLIRTDADEVTYNLHVMIRFDLELQLLEGELAVADLPEAWHARYEADLGLRAPDDRDGVLQDVHWYAGSIGGMFQCYTLGNIIGAQFYEAALRAQPDIPEQIAGGDTAALLEWMATNVYRVGRRLTPDQLIERVTCGPLDAQPLLRRLTAKFEDLYAL